MVNTRGRPQQSPEGRAVDESTAERREGGSTNTSPPRPPLLGGTWERVHRTTVGPSIPVMTEATPESHMMDTMMRAMNDAMARQQEMFMNMLDDRDARQHTHEGVADNVIPAVEKITNVNKKAEKVCSYKTFLSCKPSDFAGADNPILCMNWIREMEQAFRACECEEGSKVRFGSQMLRGNDLTWWNVFTSTVEASVIDAMSWETFKMKERWTELKKSLEHSRKGARL